jgi:RNA polymerase sigma factor (sigma-70 family)
MALLMKDTSPSHPWLAGNRDFRTTHWSVIAQAGRTEGAEASAALSKLCRDYWRPLHTFARRRGHGEEEAKDLTQSFFARLLERGDVATVSAERGRFRTFLLKAMSNFLANEWRDANRQKRGGGEIIVSLDEPGDEAIGGPQHQPASDDSPERDYDRQWVRALLAQVLERLHQEAQATGRERVFPVLKQYLIGDRGALPYAEAAKTLGMTETAVKAAIHRLRLRYGELFREEVARTVADAADLDEEIRHLLSVMS